MFSLAQYLWNQNRPFKFCLLVSVLTTALSVWLIVTLVQDTRRVTDDARDNAIQRALDSAGEISQVLESVPAVAHALADEITSGQLQDEDVEPRLLGLLAANPKISAITACFSPQDIPDFVNERGEERYCPFSYSEDNGEVSIQHIEASYDYALPNGTIGENGEPINSGWYHRPINEGPVGGSLT